MVKLLLRGLFVLLAASHFIAYAFVCTATQRRVPTILNEQAAVRDADATTYDSSSEKLRVVVVGGGWAGYSFCESISTNKNVEIILLDASKNAKGGLAGGYRSKNDRPVEAGIHGFWREYRNTFDIMEAIENVNVDDVLGNYSPSVLFSKNGKVAVAPALREVGFEDVNSFELSEMTWDVPNGEVVYDVLANGTSRTREILLGQNPEETTAIQSLMVKKYISITDGVSRPLSMPAVITSGQKPKDAHL